MTTGIRGINNRNPFNIKQTPPDPWVGSMGADELGHAIFVNEIYSVRAACRLLAKYQLTYKLTTLNAILGRWAPVDDLAAKNEPSKYAAFVADRASVHVDLPLELFTQDGEVWMMIQLTLILQAMLEWEVFSGYKLPRETIESGIALYERDFVQ